MASTANHYRAGKGKRARLSGLPGSPEFMLACEEAVRGHPVEREQRMRPPKSLRALSLSQGSSLNELKIRYGNVGLHAGLAST